MEKKALVVHCNYSEEDQDLQTIIMDMFRTFIRNEYYALLAASKEETDPQNTI